MRLYPNLGGKTGQFGASPFDFVVASDAAPRKSNRLDHAALSDDACLILKHVAVDFGVAWSIQEARSVGMLARRQLIGRENRYCAVQHWRYMLESRLRGLQQRAAEA